MAEARGALPPARGAATWLRPAAQIWQGGTALIGALSLLLQLLLVLFADGAPLPVRLVRLCSFFTIQSNVLVTVTAAMLALQPARGGPAFRVIRLDALLCIAVTGVVHFFLLRPIQHLQGWDAVADYGLHVVVPALAVAGWVLFGPRPRVSLSTVAWSVVYPLLWIAYTLIHGTIGGWYPYPFVDVSALGYGRVLLNALGVAVVFLALGGVVLLLDRRLWAAPQREPDAEDPHTTSSEEA
ncbi:MAG: Pr6Pr family membrane protein [Candidatus Dormiibacterota bacterium]